MSNETKAVARAGLSTPVAGETLFVGPAGGEVALRSVIADRYCVIALVGTRTADFPNAIAPGTPGASQGWFLMTGR